MFEIREVEFILHLHERDWKLSIFTINTRHVPVSLSFDGTFLTSQTKKRNVKVPVNAEVKGMRREAAMTLSNVLSQQLPGGSTENGQNIDYRVCLIRQGTTSHSTATSGKQKHSKWIARTDR
jgi:hypothetical protein